ncbi:DUF4194 domain-containing protein [Saccharomonospora sp.]|uniref:DUF4194 domain-containing protein n=1 Tax=Saccharomonospora sp. TaxID=33913 RepID=UPI00262FCBE3|nr:DUF4194 domain-containing protein [Saccharomonospora sp.]
MPDTPVFADIFGDALFDDTPSTHRELDPAEVFDHTDHATVGSQVPADRKPRFPGDTSQLPPEACWALQELVAAPHITDKSKKHWPVVVQYETELRSRLSELGLVLELNHEHRFAFTRQAEDPSPHSRNILRTKTLSLGASALALYLYQRYLAAPDNPVVETDDMIDHMLAYKRPDDTDEATFHKRILSAIKSLDDAAIIKPIKGTDRYLIHSVITSILTADRVEALHDRYRALARGENSRDALADTEEPADE